MPWLGWRNGYLSDWLTQQWVRGTGRKIRLTDEPWLDGPVGNVRRIGQEFFLDYARERSLEVVVDGVRGLMQDFRELCPENPSAVAASVREFYERTSEYKLDVWSEWSGLFRPLGQGLAAVFSRRLEQLNLPLSSLDTSRGMISSVLPIRDPQSNKVGQTAWVRQLVATNHTLYAGSYSVCRVPRHPTPCVKVVFPLPNGNGIVLMKADINTDGSLLLTSAGRTFGDPGFYLVVHQGDGVARARYVASLKETIHVYPAEADTVRTDHILRLWGRPFLRLHYRMQTNAITGSPAVAP